MFIRVMRWTYVSVAWIILAAVIVQFFLAGMGVFSGPSNFEAHASFGYTISFVTLLELLVAFVARLPWRTIGLTALLPLLIGFQSLFIAFWHSGLPTLAALHVINGLGIFALSGYLALRSRTVLAATKAQASMVPGVQAR